MNKRACLNLSSASPKDQKFEKGLADRGGWRQEVLPKPEIEATFLHPFSYAPLGEEGHNSGELLGSLVANPLPPTPFLRKSVVSIKFPPVILGPEMAAPILWAPGIFGLFLLENPHAHKIPPLGGGSGFF